MTAARTSHTVGLAALVIVVALSACRDASVVTPGARSVTKCGRGDTIGVAGLAYIVQNDVWNATTPQCVEVRDTTVAGFVVSSAAHNNSLNGAPASYPSVYKGCHWGVCTAGGGVSVRLAAMQAATSNWGIAVPTSGAWDAAYDIWFNQQPTTVGAPNGAELMIWIRWQGPSPFGAKVGSVSLSGAQWDVFYGVNLGLPLITYARTIASDSVALDLKGFFDDAASRGYVQASWYLIDVEAGFEIWQAGAGLRTTSFRASVP